MSTFVETAMEKEFIAVLISAFLLLYLYQTQLGLKCQSSSCYTDFDFKEKLLSKVIRMEISFEKQTEMLHTNLGEFLSDIERHRQQAEVLKDLVKSKMSELHQQSTTNSALIAESLEKMEGTLLRQVDNFSDVITASKREINGVSSSIHQQMIKLDQKAENNTAEIAEGLQRAESNMADRADTIEKHIHASFGKILNILNQKAVAFTAYEDIQGIQNGKMVFPHIAENIGDGYNTQTGTFTAPVAGVYLFTTRWGSQYARYFNLHIVMTGNANIHASYSQERSIVSNSGAVQLLSGEQVWIQCTISGYSSRTKLQFEGDIQRIIFTGALIHA